MYKDCSYTFALKYSDCSLYPGLFFFHPYATLIFFLHLMENPQNETVASVYICNIANFSLTFTHIPQWLPNT